MGDIKVYLNKFSLSGGRVFAGALAEARRREQNCVTVEHLIAALAQVEPATCDAILSELHIERSAFEAALNERLAAAPRYTGRGVRLAPETIEVCKLALKRAESYRRGKIEPVDLLVALTLNWRHNLFGVIGLLGIKPDALLKVVLEFETAVEVARAHTSIGSNLIGRQVRILSGPLANYTGYIANVQAGGEQLEVGVAVFGHRQFIEVPAHETEPLEFTRPGDLET
jgi:ATP-dependent Clp protease ATP-binding subunit ClpA